MSEPRKVSTGRAAINALNSMCVHCGAKKGKPCVDAYGHSRPPHPYRGQLR